MLYSEEYCIRFSEWVEQSIEAKYLKKIDYAKVTHGLRGAAKVLYLNLIKQIGNNRYYEVSEETVLRWLGRWEKYQTMEPKQRNRNIKRFIDKNIQAAIEAINNYEIKKHKNIYQIKLKSWCFGSPKGVFGVTFRDVLGHQKVCLGRPKKT